MRNDKKTTKIKSCSSEDLQDKDIAADLPSADLSENTQGENSSSESIEKLESADNAFKEATPSVEKTVSDGTAQNKYDIKARLPYFGTVVNKEGDKIGKVRRYICYDSDKQRMGEFVRQDSAVYLVEEDERKGYLDKNDNLFSTDHSYVATIKRSRVWLFALIFLLATALVVVSSLFAALYTPQSQNYIPTLFIADADGTSWDDQANLKVFLNEKFGDTKIEPGLSGKYTFMLENRNDDEILFDLDFTCENRYDIELVYRLKRDGAYVAGYEDHVAPEQLNLHELTQQPHSTSVFELEWTWQHNDSVDTVAGENSAMYKLFIHFLAEVNVKK